MIETRNFKDYYSKVAKEEFPDIDEASIKSIIDHGMRNMIKILTNHRDIMMVSGKRFWAFAGYITYDQEERDDRARIQKMKKIRSRGLKTCDKFTKTYYMPVSKAQYEDAFVLKHYNGFKMYKVIEEAKGCSCMYIFKVVFKDVKKKYILTYMDHETDSVECILRWTKHGYKRTNDSGECID